MLMFVINDRFYFDQLAFDNAAKSKQILSHRSINLSIDQEATSAILEGTQTIAKFNTDVFEEVHIWMATLRLPRVGSDVLITWNDPDGKVSESIFTELIGSFKIQNWNLFSASQ